METNLEAVRDIISSEFIKHEQRESEMFNAIRSKVDEQERRLDKIDIIFERAEGAVTFIKIAATVLLTISGWLAWVKDHVRL